MGANHHAGEELAGRFVLQQEWGSGGFGVVWRASDHADPKREVAVKILHDRYRTEPRVLERFVREAEILERLDHPGLARAIAWEARRDSAFIALEFIDGTSLADRLWTSSHAGLHLELSEILRIFGELSAAVQYAHDRGIVHRDLKPQNVMEERGTGRIRVLDFGIAKILDADPSESTTKGRMIGSVQYMAPEQIQGRNLDSRADVFTAGIILYEMFALRRPWLRDEANQPVLFHERDNLRGNQNGKLDVIRRVIREDRPLPSRARPGLPSAIDEVVLTALAIRRGDRYESIDALHAALVGAAESTVRASVATVVQRPPAELTAVLPVDLDGRTDVASTVAVNPAKRRIRPILALGAGLLLSIGALVFFGLSAREHPTSPAPLAAQKITATPRQRSWTIDQDPASQRPSADPETLPLEEPKKRVHRASARRARSPVTSLDQEADRFALARRIEEEAAQLADPRDRTTVKRCAADTSMVVDDEEALRALSACLRIARVAGAESGP